MDDLWEAYELAARDVVRLPDGSQQQLDASSRAMYLAVHLQHSMEPKPKLKPWHVVRAMIFVPIFFGPLVLWPMVIIDFAWRGFQQGIPMHP